MMGISQANGRRRAALGGALALFSALLVFATEPAVVRRMTFANVALAAANGGPAMIPQVAVDAAAQTATFGFDKPLPVGSYTLSMDYTGKIGTQANGLFAIDYVTDAGKKRALDLQKV